MDPFTAIFYNKRSVWNTKTGKSGKVWDQKSMKLFDRKFHFITLKRKVNLQHARLFPYWHHFADSYSIFQFECNLILNFPLTMNYIIRSKLIWISCTLRNELAQWIQLLIINYHLHDWPIGTNLNRDGKRWEKIVSAYDFIH